MTEILLTPAAEAAWLPGFEHRLRERSGAVGYPGAAVVELLTKVRDRQAPWHVAEIASDGVRVGFVAVTAVPEHGTTVARILDLWVEPDHAGRGHEEAARAWAEKWAAEQGAERIAVRLLAPSPAFDDWPVRGQTRLKAVPEAAAPLPEVVGRPMTAAEYPAWVDGERDAYAADIARSGAVTPAEARAKAERDFAELLPEGLATPGHSLWILEAAGEPVGTGWLKHGFLPGVSFGYSLEVHPEHRGRGYGRAAMLAGEQITRAAGDTALMFSVWGGNEVAMNLYTGAGFQVADETRSIDLGTSSTS